MGDVRINADIDAGENDLQVTQLENNIEEA